ncbi:protease modulator HflC [Puniceicoccus vermicola]|uniref:Protein HflC n=1 Tax=Puniceicoccus vermicola TaxID=388746 RepID=A0A7X1AYI8_9BACT|nr:protease modulator HflC [Puniceicoccus vermicola]MBC2602322.1 protease modulator HflC [Puniceicoccus vermicola]
MTAARKRNPAVLWILGLIAAIVLVAAAWTSLYTISEWEQAVITEFGEVVGDPVTQAGLHVKRPWQQVRRFDSRLQRWDGRQTTTITRDRKTVNVDVTARWRIDDAKQFLEAVNSINQADTRLNGIIAGAVKDEIAKYDLYEVIRSSNGILDIKTEELSIKLDSGDLEEISVEEVATLGSDLPELHQSTDGAYLAGRPIVLQGILQEARKRLAQIGLGIALEDILIKQLNYTQEIESNVYAQMNAELQKISAGFRSNGKKRAEQRLGEMERELARISSEAEQRAQVIRGQAEAKAIRIYAEAYNQDPGFYRFLRTLQAYDKGLGGNSRILIGSGSPFFDLLNSIDSTDSAAEGNP